MISLLVNGGYIIDTVNDLVLNAVATSVDSVTAYYLYTCSLGAVALAAASNGPILYFTR